MGGWFNKEINSLDDLNGLKIRMPGLGGEVLRKVGAAAVAIPGGEIFSSLKSGAIDATEWVGPWNDLSLAFYQAAQYYYWPGFHEPGAGLATGINLDTWNSFTLSEQSIIRQVLAYENTYTLAEFNHHNAIALDTLINKHKVKMRTFSDEIMSELKVISEGVIEEVSTRTEISKRIFNSFKDSMKRLNDWSSKSEQAYMKARSIK
jgi:TRAP-type mannitol/chloroaromatic compound transport system substrate-binding protein